MKNLEVFDRVVVAGIDILNDFSPSGALPVAEGDQIVFPFNEVSRWARQQGARIIQVKENHPREDNDHFKEFGGPWPVHGVAGTWGAEFIPGLEVEAEDLILLKGSEANVDAYSGYMGVGANGETIEALAEPAQQEKVALIIGGLATDYCVKATVLDALEQANRIEVARGGKLGVFVLKDAIRAVNINPGDGVRAIAEMEAAGAQMVTADELAKGQLLMLQR